MSDDCDIFVGRCLCNKHRYNVCMYCIHPSVVKYDVHDYDRARFGHSVEQLSSLPRRFAQLPLSV